MRKVGGARICGCVDDLMGYAANNEYQNKSYRALEIVTFLLVSIDFLSFCGYRQEIGAISRMMRLLERKNLLRHKVGDCRKHLR